MKIAFLLLFFFVSFYVYSQGCSDAGFCTLTSFKPTEEKQKKQIKVGGSWGRADHNIHIFSTAIEYSHPIHKTSGVDVKFTTLGQSGNDISLHYPSDIFLNYKYAYKKWRLALGVKLPLNSANKKINNFSLPLDYQSSLGTMDVIAGVSFDIKKTKWAVAIQQPLTQNKNEFSASDFPVGELSLFTTTYRFKRKGDVLTRVSYPVSIKKFTVTPGALAIYHLGNDTYTSDNEEKEIKGSAGFTVNAVLFLDYKVSKKSSLHFTVGAPLAYRQVRPDGLTRKVITTLEYSFMF